MYFFLMHTMESLLLAITYETSPIEKMLGHIKPQQRDRTHIGGTDTSYNDWWYRTHLPVLRVAFNTFRLL